MRRFVGSIRQVRGVLLFLGLGMAGLTVVALSGLLEITPAGWLYGRVSESTVLLRFQAPVPGAAQGDTTRKRFLGSGFYIAPHLILTCAHVADTASQCEVYRGPASGPPVAGHVLFSDTLRDIAVIHTSTTMPPLKLTRDKPWIGETVYTIGSPDGLMGSFGEGIVSQWRSDSASGVGKIQCTSPVEGGSSGSPILDKNGFVVGMVTSSTHLSSYTLGVDVPTIFAAIERAASAQLYGVEYSPLPAIGKRRTAEWPVAAGELLSVLGDSWALTLDWDLVGAAAFLLILLLALLMAAWSGFARRRRWARERIAAAEWKLARGQAFLPEAMG